MDSGSGNPVDRVTEGVQKALEDLRGAGEKATGDVRSRIDSAVQRLNDVSGQATSRAQEATSKAQDQVAELRTMLEQATEDVREQLAKLAVKAQNSTETLEGLKDDIEARLKELGR